MKLYDIINLSANIVGQTNVVNYVKGVASNTNPTADAETLADVDLFTTLANLVIRELAGTYIYMKATQNFTTNNKRIAYSSFTVSPVEILAVYDANGISVSYKENREYLEVAFSSVSVEYAYIPSNYSLSQEIGYSEKEISITALSFGVAGEYCLATGRFDEAVMFRKRYSDAIEQFCLPKNRKVKRRGWL